MNDAFAKLIGPILQYGLSFQERLQHGDQPPLSEVRSELLALVDEADQKAAASRELTEDFALARRALIYWIDEVLINSNWSHAGAWRDHILELDFYQERIGGEKFFEKAREAETRARTDPLETFFLCVALGFQGRYALSLPELRGWATRAYQRIAQANQPPERFLPDDPQDTAESPLRPLPGATVLLTVSILVSVSILVTLAGVILSTHLAS